MLRDYAALLRAGEGAESRQTPAADWVKRRLVERAVWYVETLGGPSARNSRDGGWTPEEVSQALQVVEDAVRRLAGAEPLPERLANCLIAFTPPFAETWRNLERLCRRLEAMAHKQLRGLPWTDRECDCLLDFGHVLAAAMLYGGNAYLSPRADAPRATSVYADLRDPRAPVYFQVGIARPRALYLLYPDPGGEILCRGAVLPYREFLESKRLTDAEWKDRLDSGHPPPAPEWAAPIWSPAPPAKPR